MSYLKDFREKIALNDYQGFLTLWEEYCYNDKPDAVELKQILQETKASELTSSFGRHIERALLIWELIPPSQIKDDVLTLIYDIETTNSEELYERAINFLSEKYPNDKYFEEKLRLVGLKGKDSFQGCLQGYILLTHLNKGKFAFHKAGWGTGEILDLSMIREEVTLEFEFLLGTKTLSFKNALKTLIPLPDDHFLAKRFGNPDELEKDAKENPLQIMHLLLRDLGPKTAAEIKEELCELVIPENDWSRWWQTARNKIKKDTKIESPRNIKQPFKLLKEDISHEETLYKALDAKPGINQTIALVYSFMKNFPSALKNEEIKKSLQTKVNEVFSSSDLTEAQKIQFLFFLEDLGEKRAEVNEIIKNHPSIPDLIDEIEILSFKKRILIILRKEKDDWMQIFFSLFFSLQQNLLRDYLLNALITIKPKSILEDKIKELLSHPLIYPHLFVWYFQKLFEKKSDLPFSDTKGIIKFFEGFFVLLDHLEQKIEFKDLSKKMVSIITANRYKLIRDIFEKASKDEVKEFLLLSTKCRLLSDHDRKIIHSLATVAHPSLENKNIKKEDENVIWTTEEGYEQTKKRMEQIATVETIQNAKEIEEARSHGDLRENAEYKAALEKRARLQGELKFLSDQFNRAKIIEDDDVSTDSVGIGTVVTCVNSKGSDTTFTLLGPWDANPDNNILSFQSKLAQSMKGLKIGETFEFQHEKYTVKEIANYFKTKK